MDNRTLTMQFGIRMLSLGPLTWTEPGLSTPKLPPPPPAAGHVPAACRLFVSGVWARRPARAPSAPVSGLSLAFLAGGDVARYTACCHLPALSVPSATLLFHDPDLSS